MGTKTDEKVDLSKLKPKKITEFSVKRPDDKKNVDVKSLVALSDRVIIVDYDNCKLKMYDGNGNFLSSTDLMDYTWGITRVNNDKFAACGDGNKVFLWTVCGESIVREDEVYNVDHRADSIHFNNTYYCVLHGLDNAVTLLDRKGKQVRKIVMEKAFGKKIKFRFDIHMDRDTHDIYVPCWTPEGVLCMSVEGEVLWITSLSGDGLWGITEIHGALCVADSLAQCLHLISKTGQYVRKLLVEKEEELEGLPYHIHYDDHEQKLFVSYLPTIDKRDTISVFSA